MEHPKRKYTENLYNHNIRGYVKEGFEAVLFKFSELHQNGNDKNSQICIYVGSELVVDLY